jgi:glycosyltransferase involved in cell wall biosynthesis/peptidoglycan/xylan/chitin deacetylase (PgdA/CDA1 family)
VTHTLISRQIGGAERYVIDLCRYLGERGYGSDLILSSDAPNVVESVQSAGVPFVEMSICGDLNFMTSVKVARSLKRSGAQLLNVHDNASACPCCLGGRLARVPVVATVHAFHCKWPFIAADHLIAVSDALRQHLISQGFRTNRITVVRNGVDPERFRPGDRIEARREFGLDPDQTVFAVVGRIARRKGLEMLMEVFAEVFKRLPGARLLVAGTGPLEPTVRAQVKELQLDDAVRFVGFRTDVRPVFAAADCLVMPSETEGLGLSLLEAMASGRPAIVTDSGGPREVVRDTETGILIPPNCPEKLLSSMIWVAANPKWMCDAGIAASQTVKEAFSLVRQIDGIAEVYDRLVEQAANRCVYGVPTMHQGNRPASLVLMYHRMGSPIVRSIVRGQYVLPFSLRRQLKDMLSDGYRPLSLADLLSGPEYSKGCFSITFDDGYASMRRLAYPVLAEQGVPATIFVVAGGVGRTNEWDVKIGDRTEKMLNLADIREMAAGGIEIGSHTMSHAHCTQLSDADLRMELRDSKRALEDMLGKPVVGFAYPYGDWDARVREAVIEAEYKYAVITTRGAITDPIDLFAVPRLNIRWNTFGRLLRRKIRSAYERDEATLHPPCRESV